MPQITNAEIMKEVTSIKAETVQLNLRLEKVESRMNAYDKTAEIIADQLKSFGNRLSTFEINLKAGRVILAAIGVVVTPIITTLLAIWAQHVFGK